MLYIPRRIYYKGYVISAAPYQLAETGKWAIKVNIEKHTATGVKSRPFIASNTFDTKEEAVEQCLIYGQNIIDGGVKGLSIDDL